MLAGALAVQAMLGRFWPEATRYVDVMLLPVVWYGIAGSQRSGMLVGCAAGLMQDVWFQLGVLGLNGAGKSSLLRIMAGEDREFDGEAFPAKTATVGYLPQEPQLDPAKTVLENVEEAVAGTKALLARFNEVSDKFAEPLEPDEMDKLLAEQAKLQDKIDACSGWELESRLDLAMEALLLLLRGIELRLVLLGDVLLLLQHRVLIGLHLDDAVELLLRFGDDPFAILLRQLAHFAVDDVADDRLDDLHHLVAGDDADVLLAAGLQLVEGASLRVRLDGGTEVV